MRSSRCPSSGSGGPISTRLLAANDSKAARERLTLMRIFEALRGLGYEGGYDAVRRYARSWRRERVGRDGRTPMCR